MFIASQYGCYQFTVQELNAIKFGNPTKRGTCESHQGFVFSRGDNTLAPGCGECLCCQPGNIYITL